MQYKNLGNVIPIKGVDYFDGDRGPIGLQGIEGPISPIAPLPKFCFLGNIANMTVKTDIRKVQFFYYEGETYLSGWCTLKIQGTSSLVYPKKNYTVTLFSDAACSIKQEVNFRGWGATNSFCLKANWIDATHSRNVVAAKIATKVQENYYLFTQAPCNGLVDGFPIRFYINGRYHGLYTCNIPKGKFQFGMSASATPNAIVMSAENNTAPNSCGFEAARAEGDWEIEFAVDETNAFQRLDRLITFVKDSTDVEFKANFDAYLNLSACLNYFCLASFFFLQDNLAKNMLLATYDGNIWYPSLYDLDTAAGLYFNGEGVYAVDTRMPNAAGYATSKLWSKLITSFGAELQERYDELLSLFQGFGVITQEFDDFYKKITDNEFTQDLALWPDIPSKTILQNQIENYISVHAWYVWSQIQQIYFAPQAHEDTRIVYSLPNAYQGFVGRWLDTGKAVFANEGSFTLFVRFRNGLFNQDGTDTIIGCENQSPYDGVRLSCASDHSTSEYVMLLLGADTSNSLSTDDSTRAYSVVAFSYNGATGACKAYRDKKDNAGSRVLQSYTSKILNPVNQSLCIGADTQDNIYNPDTGFRFYQGEVTDTVIYNVVLEDTEVISTIDLLLGE